MTKRKIDLKKVAEAMENSPTAIIKETNLCRVAAKEIIEMIEELTEFPAKVHTEDAWYIIELIKEKYGIDYD